MTTRAPILDRTADTLVRALWWLDRRLPARCAVCRARVQWRRMDQHVYIEHAEVPQGGEGA